jgi:hypothetical protein
MDTNKEPLWVMKGKTISQLIEELQTFSDQTLEVQISIDDGEIRRPISLVAKSGKTCLLVYCGKDSNQ